MHSQHSGNNSELLFIEMEEVYFTIKENKAATGYGESKSLTIIIEGKQCVDEINRFLYFLLFSNLLK
jgi:hypothetical protein